MATIKDFDLSMTKLSTGSIGIKEDAEAIMQSIKICLLTRKGEKLFDPDYGAGIGDYTDDSISNLNSLSIASDIFYAIKSELNNLKIVEKNDIKVVAKKKEKRYDIKISYKKNDIAEKETITFALSTN